MDGGRSALLYCVPLVATGFHCPLPPMPPLARVCVFCGSRPGRGSAYGEAARALGCALADRGVGLVFGGAKVGLMGAVADAVLARGGEAIGVIPGFMVDRELAHPGLTALHTVRTMHERKALMAELSDGFVALPGGIGTFEELFEAWTWAQIGVHRKPVGLLNVAGYYEPLAAFLQHVWAEGFLREPHGEAVLLEAEPVRLLDRLVEWVPPVAPSPPRATVAEF
jgi:uncharacterized protein (TIGR00730 family)